MRIFRPPYHAAVDRANRDDLLGQVREDRQRFDAILERVPRERLADPVLPGGWSVKDVLAHIAWGEREALGVMNARALVGSELWNVSEDERNEAVVRESRSRASDEVLHEYRIAFADFTAALEQLSDEDLNDPERFTGMSEGIPGWRPWRVLYDPTHYDEHGHTIEAAFAASESERHSR